MSNTHLPAEREDLDEDHSLLDLPLHEEASEPEDEFDETDPDMMLHTEEADPDDSRIEGSGLFGNDLDLSELDDGADDAEIARAIRESDADYEGAPPAPLRDRALAGLADLLMQLFALGTAVFGVHMMGVILSPSLWMPFFIQGLVFSFLYWFIPLAFWGQTPGMGWMGHQARSLDDQPLSFAQSALRWCGGLFTLGLLGLPLLLALTGRSFTDRLSDSKTVLPDD